MLEGGVLSLGAGAWVTMRLVSTTFAFWWVRGKIPYIGGEAWITPLFVV